MGLQLQFDSTAKTLGKERGLTELYKLEYLERPRALRGLVQGTQSIVQNELMQDLCEITRISSYRLRRRVGTRLRKREGPWPRCFSERGGARMRSR